VTQRASGVPSAAIGRRSLLGNFLSLSASTWAAQAVSFLVVVYVARVLGASRLGQVALAQAIVLQFRFVADIGFDLLGGRRIAADRAAAPAVVAELAGARLLNAAIAGGALAAVALAVDRFVPVGWVTVVFGLSLVCWALSLEWAFMGLERMDLVGLARLAAAVVWLLLVLALVRDGTPLVVVPAAYVAGQACAAGLLFARFRRAHGPVRLRHHHVAWFASLRQAAPVGLSLIAIQVHVGFGLVALGLFDGDRAAGLYAAPQRLVLFLTAVSSMFGAAVYPRLSALWAEGGGGFERAVRLGVRVMVLASVPLAVGGALVARPLIGLVYGPGYEDGAVVLRWLVPSVVPISISMLFGYALLAAGGERRYFLASVSGAAVVVSANVALIPRLHILAPAVASVAAECAVFVLMASSMRRVVSVAAGRAVWVAAAAAALMAGAILVVRSAPVAAQIAVGAVVYVAGVTAFKGLTAADVGLMREFSRTTPSAPGAAFE
jgi:O-antigen/teichoic acid export membrane protein